MLNGEIDHVKVELELENAHATSNSPLPGGAMSMELSVHEQEIVQSLRDAVKAEVVALRHCLEEAADVHHHLTRTNQYLEAENRALMEVLDEHGIIVSSTNNRSLVLYHPDNPNRY
jgi:hypothetical protein